MSGMHRKNRLTHEQLVNELEFELLRIHRDEVAADAISVHRPYDNTPAPRGAKAATRPAARAPASARTTPHMSS